MAKITLTGGEIETIGNLPEIGSTVPDFTLTATDLSEKKLSDFQGQIKVLNIFPSLDTGICAASVRRFNQEADKLKNTSVLCISADLPFAHNRFCELEGLKSVIPLSVFRSPDFEKDYQVTIKTGPLRGLLSRAIIILDETNKVVYHEQVPEIVQEPDYEKALAVVFELVV